MISFTTTVRATAIALVIATVAAPVAGAATGGRITAHKAGFSAQVGADHGAWLQHGQALIVPTTSTEHSDAVALTEPLIVPTGSTEHGAAAGLTEPLIVPTGSTEHMAGAPATVIIRSAPAAGFDWTAATIGALVAMAAALLAYGAATVLRSRSGELVNN